MIKTLNATPDPSIRRKRIWRIEAAALILLIPLAAYLWAAPILADRALAKASLHELIAASRQHPDRPRIFYYLGVRYRQAGNLQEAEHAFSQSATLGDDNEATWLAWAAATTSLGREDDAGKILTLFLKSHPR